MLDFDVVELPETDNIEEGETAPDFTRPLVNDEYWEDTSLSEVVEESDDGVVLVFHPMDGSFPAIYIWNEIQERGWADEAEVVGDSVSTPYEHIKFIDDNDLDARLFSDPSNEVAEEYGVVHDLDGMEGIEEPRPAVFVLDDEMRVEHTWVASEWPEFPDYDEVEESTSLSLSE